MARNAYELDELLGAVPLDRRIGHLVVSLIGRKPENVRACGSLLSLFAVLAAHMQMSNIERVLIANELRDLADEVEHARERVEV
jgi:kynureninase